METTSTLVGMKPEMNDANLVKEFRAVALRASSIRNLTTVKYLFSLEAGYVAGSGEGVSHPWPFFKLPSTTSLTDVIQPFLNLLTDRCRKLTCSVWNCSNREGSLRSRTVLQSYSSAIFSHSALTCLRAITTLFSPKIVLSQYSWKTLTKDRPRVTLRSPYSITTSISLPVYSNPKGATSFLGLANETER